MKKVFKIVVIAFLFISVTAQNSFSQNDEILFRRHLVVSGWNGLLYGSAFDYIFGIDGAAAAGLPLITAGGCVLVPLLTNTSKSITSNQLLLSSHGQTIGWLHGFAVGALINGSDMFETESKSKLSVGLGMASSIGLGILGNSLGKNKKDWSEGRVALYRHYGWTTTLTGLCISAAFSDDARLSGATDLVFGAGGYLLANQVNKMHEFTRGEVRSVQALTVLNGALGTFIAADVQPDNVLEWDRSGWLIPAAGLWVGTLGGQLWLKDSNFTASQGMTTWYAMTGGLIIGSGIDLIAKSDNFTTNYLIPYATGLAAYSFAVIKLKHDNAGSSYIDNKDNRGWNLTFMPQNVFLNKKIESNGFQLNGMRMGMQPLFSANLTF